VPVVNTASRQVQARLADTLAQLVDIESVSGNEGPVTDFVRSRLPGSFRLAYDHDTVLVAVPKARRQHKPLVFLAGHTDTVPVVDNLPSRIDENGTLWGRGSSDMKSGLAVMLELAANWERLSVDSPYDLGLCFFGREELAAHENPLPFAIQECAELSEAKLAILMEPTSNHLELGCLGNLNFTLSFQGEAAHTARPWLGVNAVHKAVRALQQLVDVQPKAVMVDGLPYIECVNVTGFLGGTARNVLPPKARVEVNVRYGPNRHQADIERHWVEQFKELATVDIVGNAAAAPPAANDPLVQALQACVQPAARSKQAWTNVADFAALGIPAVNFGPGDPSQAHRDDEHVNLVELMNCWAILARFLNPQPQANNQSSPSHQGEVPQ
jgi:succinyl-diaminopimelate desuccinylase